MIGGELCFSITNDVSGPDHKNVESIRSKGSNKPLFFGHLALSSSFQYSKG